MFFGRKSFAEIESEAHAELDDAYAEMWTHIKTVSRPNYPSAPDRKRPAYMLLAKFTREPRGVKIGLEESSVSSNDPGIVIQACNLKYPVDRGDRFQRCATGDFYEVTNSNHDTVSGIIVDLVQLGLQE